MKYDFRARSDASKLMFESEHSLTKQEFKNQVNINNILKKYTKNGINPFVIAEGAKFGDFSALPSYQDAMNVVAQANETFAQLPSNIRKRFSNDPGEFLEFFKDPNNEAEARRLGLLVPKAREDENSSPGASKAPLNGSDAKGGTPEAKDSTP